jgi:hypothetical protein
MPSKIKPDRFENEGEIYVSTVILVCNDQAKHGKITIV